MNSDGSTVLVTGDAGFIGNHVALRLVEEGHRVVGVDNHSDYYDPVLKEARVARLAGLGGYRHERVDIADAEAISACFAAHRPARVIHLAAQPGVRYSIEHPDAYVRSNLVGFANVLECCRRHEVAHTVFASTSSVYGANGALPSREDQPVSHPLSFYAATKMANEAMAHSYCHLYGLPMSGLRFFTVYGEWGRPDMAFFRFTEAILAGRPIEVYNEGRLTRDFTYVADIVEGVVRLLDHAPTADHSWDARRPDPSRSGVAPYRIYNIGNGQPVELMRYIAVLEECLGRKAALSMLPMQPGDVEATWADCSALAAVTGYRPQTGIETGLANFVAWYRDYYGTG